MFKVYRDNQDGKTLEQVAALGDSIAASQIEAIAAALPSYSES